MVSQKKNLSYDSARYSWISRGIIATLNIKSLSNLRVLFHYSIKKIKVIDYWPPIIITSFTDFIELNGKTRLP